MIAARQDGVGMLAGEVLVDDVREHELVGIDAGGQLCTCGARDRSWLEHLAVVTLAVLGAPPLSADRTRERSHVETMAEALDRTRRLLREIADRSEERWAELDATGLVSFTDRFEWLMAHRTRLEVLADELRMNRMIVDAAKVASRRRFVVTPDVLDRIRVMNEYGWSDAEIGRALGAAAQTVQCHRSRMGLPVRIRGRRSDADRDALASATDWKAAA